MFCKKKVTEEPKKRLFQIVETVEMFFQEVLITYEDDREFSTNIYDFEQKWEHNYYHQPLANVGVVDLAQQRSSLIHSIQHQCFFHTFHADTKTPTLVSLKNIKKVTFGEPEFMGTTDTVSWTVEE